MRVAGEARAAPVRAARPTRASRAALPQEHVVARLRQSGRRLVLPALLFIALCGAVGYWGPRPAPTWFTVAVLAAAGLVALLLCVVPLLRWLGRVVLITDRRIATRGFGRREELVLVPGGQVQLRRGPLQLLAGSGDVVVSAGGASIRLVDVPSARLVHAAITELVSRLG